MLLVVLLLFMCLSFSSELQAQLSREREGKKGRKKERRKRGEEEEEKKLGLTNNSRFAALLALILCCHLSSTEYRLGFLFLLVVAIVSGQLN